MKRMVCLLVLLSLLCGCRSVEVQTPPTYAVPLSGTVRVTTDLIQWRADWTYTADNMTFTLTAPPELAGTTVTCGEECSMTKDKVSVPIAPGATFLSIQKVWQNFLSQTATFSQTPEGWQYDLSATDSCTIWQSLDGSSVRFDFDNQTIADFSVEMAPVE